MKKKLRWVLPLVVLVSILLMAQECVITVTIEDFNTAPEGIVVDAATGEGIDAAVISLDDPGDSAAAFTTTTGTDGVFAFPDETERPIPPGDYQLYAEKAGYVFAPQTVSINGAGQFLGEIIGFSYGEEQISDIRFVLMWDDNYDDLDAYFTYPAASRDNNEYTVTGDGTVAPPFTGPYDIPTGTEAADGFFPEDAAVGSGGYSYPSDAKTAGTEIRDRIFWYRPSSATDAVGTFDGTTATTTLDWGTADYAYDPDATEMDTYRVELDTDATLGSGPETITFRYPPFTAGYAGDATGRSTYGGGTTGLPELTEDYYVWSGVMEYYVRASAENWDADTIEQYLSTAETDTEGAMSAGATLYVFQGPDVLGIYSVPTHTDISAASLIRINVFELATENYYQIVPNLDIVTADDQIRGIGGSDGMIGVTGPGGRN